MKITSSNPIPGFTYPILVTLNAKTKFCIDIYPALTFPFGRNKLVPQKAFFLPPVIHEVASNTFSGVFVARSFSPFPSEFLNIAFKNKLFFSISRLVLRGETRGNFENLCYAYRIRVFNGLQ